MSDLKPTEFILDYRIPHLDYFFNLKWDGNGLFLKEFSPKLGINQQNNINPENHEWEEFLHRMEEIRVWDWYEEYVVNCQDSCVEGDEWEVSMVFGDFRIESHGANSYPSSFQEFLQAIEELTGIIIEFIQQD